MKYVGMRLEVCVVCNVRNLSDEAASPLYALPYPQDEAEARLTPRQP